MSSKLEDLDEIQEIEEAEDTLEHFEDEYDEEAQEAEEELHQEIKKIDNKTLYKAIYDMFKHPLLVVLLTFILNNKYLVKLMNNLPYIQTVERYTSVNFLLACIVGILFFLLRDLV